jgi:DNA-directed RNA polymerase sigma subunit (sigma70/sigma32)
MFRRMIGNLTDEEQLTSREIFVLCQRFGIGTERKTLQAISNMMDVTRERVRQIEKRALQKLKDNGMFNE